MHIGGIGTGARSLMELPGNRGTGNGHHFPNEFRLTDAGNFHRGIVALANEFLSELIAVAVRRHSCHPAERFEFGGQCFDIVDIA